MRKLRNTELNRKTIEEFKKSKKTSAIVILDNIRSIHNVGSIFRTADGMGASKIFLSGYTCKPPQKDLAKTLQRISNFGWKEFYTGETADMIINCMNRTDGLISKDDLKNYRPIERKPISRAYTTNITPTWWSRD